MDNCLFCKIIKGDIPTNKVYENEHILAFRDIDPKAPVHILVIPKKHIKSINDLKSSDKYLAGELILASKKIAKDQGINVEIKKLSIDELKSSAKNGSLKEIFGAGTAAVVSEIKGFQHKKEYFELKEQDDSYATRLKDNLTGIQTNKLEDPHNWRFKI